MPRNNPSMDHALRALRLINRLNRWAAASVQTNHLSGELSLRQLAVLFDLQAGITSPGQLARRMLVTPAVITGLLDRLERQGYVKREPEPEDRRRLRMVLTKDGLAVAKKVQDAVAGELAGELENASPAALEELGRALVLLEQALGTLENRTPTALKAGIGDDDVVSDLSAEEQRPVAPPARSARTARSRATPAKNKRK